jgi:hypothetical protein
MKLRRLARMQQTNERSAGNLITEEMAKRVKVEALPNLIDTTSSAFHIKKGKQVPLNQTDEAEDD